MEIGDNLEKQFEALAKQLIESYLSQAVDDDEVPRLYDRVMDLLEEPLLRLSLSTNRHRQLWAARQFGISRATFRKKLRYHDQVQTRKRRQLQGK